MPSFDIDPQKLRKDARAAKVRNLAKGGATEGERTAALSKTTGPSLPKGSIKKGMNPNEEVVPGLKIVDIILGEEKCGKGMYWCNTDKKCKKVPSGFKISGQPNGKNRKEVGIGVGVHGGSGSTNGGSVDENVTIEDAFGNKFVEFIDLIKPDSILGEKSEPDHEVSMAQAQLDKSQKNISDLKKKLGKKEKNIPAWVQAKITDTEHNTDAAAGYTKESSNVDEKMNIAKAKMGDVIGDFYTSDAPQFKGKSKAKRRQMAIAAKLEAERQNEEVSMQEAVRLPSEFGHIVSVVVMWRGKSYQIRMFFPQAKMPSRTEVQTEIEKVYPGGKVLSFMRSDLPSNFAPINSPLFKVTKEEYDKKSCKKCKCSPCECDKEEDDDDDEDEKEGKIEEKRGLYANIHAKRRRGERPARPGEEDYPESDAFKKAAKTAKEEVENVGEGLKQARKNVGAKKCWDGYKAKGTKTKNGRQVPNCVPEEYAINAAAAYLYNEGFNSTGVEILIEELGLEDFATFVFELGEETLLTEARAGGVKVEPKTKAGKPVGQLKGGAKTAAINRLRKEKQARKSAEASASSEKPSGMKAALKRQSAVANAKKQQPKKKGVLDRVAGAVLKGIDRHNAAMAKAKKDIDTTKKVAKKVGKGASEFGKGVASGVKTAGKVAKAAHKLLNNEFEIEEGKTPVTRQAGDFRYSGKTGEEKAERRAKVLSNSPDPKKRRQANTIRSKIKTVADRDTAQASSDARQKLYRGQQRRANDLAQQLISKNRNESVNEDVHISGGNVGSIIIGGELPKKSEAVGEHFTADVVWKGRLYNLEMVLEGGELPSRKELGEQLQDEYPGAVVQNVYPSLQKGSIKVTSAKHYNHGTLSWIDEDWQKANRKDKTDGLSQKAVDAYRRENPGSKLQTAVTEKNPKGKRKKRRSSFCSRMKGMKSKLTSSKTARDPDSRINKALRRWNCR